MTPGRPVVVVLVTAMLTMFGAAGHAQGPPNRPVPVEVTNVPLPVRVVPPANELTVTCTRSTASGGGSGEYFSGGSAGPVSSVTCPEGIQRVLIRHVSYEPSASLSAWNYRVMIAISPDVGIVPPTADLLAMLSNGSPERELARPRLLDLSSTESFSSRVECFSGLAGVAVNNCGGRIRLVGTPLP